MCADYLVSAIVSTYNSESFIRGCLEDLENQTIADRLEIVVVNSGSQQDEDKVIKEFMQKYSNIVYVKTEKRETIYKAWNRGIQRAAGKYITNANTDDRHRPDALERMTSHMETNPGIDGVYAWQWISNIPNEFFFEFIELDPLRWPETVRERMSRFLQIKNIKKIESRGRIGYFFQWPPFSDARMQTTNNIIGPQPMWKKEVHQTVGFFDERYEIGGDYEFWLRMSRKRFRFQLIPEILGVFYLGGTNREFYDERQTLLERWWRLQDHFLHHPNYLSLKVSILYHLVKLEPGNGLYLQELETLFHQELSDIQTYRIASLYKQLGHYSRSRKWFEWLGTRSLNADMRAGLLFHLGELDDIAGDRQAALNRFREVMKLNPRHRKAREYQKRLLNGGSIENQLR